MSVVPYIQNNNLEGLLEHVIHHPKALNRLEYDSHEFPGCICEYDGAYVPIIDVAEIFNNCDLDLIVHLFQSTNLWSVEAFLSDAAICGNLEVVRWVLSNYPISWGNLQNADYRTLKHLDVVDEFFEAVNLMLEHGMMNSRCDKWRIFQDLLNLAILDEREELARVLLESGMDIQFEAWKMAIEIGNQTIVETMCRYGDVPKNALCFLRKDWDYEMVDLLVENGANIDGSSSNKTVLGRAIELGYIDLVEYLMELGVNLNKMSGGRTPMELAFFHERTCVVKMLLSEGANASFLDADECEDLKLLKLLLDHGAEVNGEVLLFAVEARNNVLVEFLVNHGANVNYTQDGKTVLDRLVSSTCMTSTDPELAEYLVFHGARYNHKCASISWKGRIKHIVRIRERVHMLTCIRWMQENGSDCGLARMSDNLLRNHMDLVEAMLDSGLVMGDDIGSNLGIVTMSTLISKGHGELLWRIVSEEDFLGLDEDIQKTFFSNAVIYRSGMAKELVEMGVCIGYGMLSFMAKYACSPDLVQCIVGANPTCLDYLDKDGNSPLMVAIVIVVDRIIE